MNELAWAVAFLLAGSSNACLIECDATTAGCLPAQAELFLFFCDASFKIDGLLLGLSRPGSCFKDGQSTTTMGKRRAWIPDVRKEHGQTVRCCPYFENCRCLCRY